MASSQASSPKRSRRTKGTGSIFPTKEGTFRASIKLRQLDGTEQPFSKRFDTEAEAETWLAEIIVNHRGGARQNLPKQKQGLTVQDMFRDWLAVKYAEAQNSGKPARSTVDDYAAQTKMWILPTLGTVECTRLHEDNVNAWLGVLNRAVSDKTGKKLSHDRKHRVWGVFSRGVKWGAANKYLPRIPLNDIRGIIAESGDVQERVMTEGDYRKFVSYIAKKGCQHKQGYCQLRWELAIKLARRQGEVLGLGYEQVFLTADEPYFEVKYHLKREKWLHACGPGKPDDEGNIVFPCKEKYAKKCSTPVEGGLVLIDGTKGGKFLTPSLPISASLLKVFIEHKRQHQAELAEAVQNGTYSPLRPEHKNLVFLQPKTQRAFNPRQDNRRFEELQQEAGLEKRYQLHGLRHSSVSRIVAVAGLQVGKDIAGHKSMLTTSRYAKQGRESMAEALAAVDAKTAARTKAAKKKKKKKAEPAAESA